MISAYQIESSRLLECDKESAAVLVYHQPSDAEKEDFLRVSGLEPLDLESVYDPDEVPRVETFEDNTLLIWKCPDNVAMAESPPVQFNVSSLGIVISRNRAIFIVPRGAFFLTGRGFKQVQSVGDCVLRVLLHFVHHYQAHLKAIKMMSQELQAKIVTSMENRYLLQMFALGESLIYYHNALEANLAVLAKLRAVPDRLKLASEEISFLEDVIIEYQQASKQAGIYSMVLSGLMDARGTIVNNNMNVLLKNLTVINVVFLPLNLIASIGGMSEFSAMTSGVEWWISYGLFSLTMVILGWATWWWLGKVIERNQRRFGQANH